MNNLDMTLLNRLLAVETTSGECDAMQIAVAEIADEWRELGIPINWGADAAGNLWLWRDDAPAGPAPWIVAHMDTVHPITGNGIHPVQVGDSIIGVDPVEMLQVGVGGDDKCGLYAALHLIRQIPAVRVLLTVDEETGGHGAYAADLEELRSARFILQADRRGGQDFVTRIGGRDLSSEAFQDAVAPLLAKHGFKACAFGGFTDVGVLSERAVGVSVANMSAGYYYPHSDREMIHLPDLSRTVALMADICETVPGRWPFTAPPVRRWDRPEWSLTRKQRKAAASAPLAEAFPDWEPDGLTCWPLPY